MEDFDSPSGFVTPVHTVPPSRADSPNQPVRTRFCVFCGAFPGNNPQYLQVARDLARVMAAADIELVYGGGTAGMMGEVAKTLVELKGPDYVHGIIPEALLVYERNITSHTSVGTGASGQADVAEPAASTYGHFTIVKDMHQRKRTMAQEVIKGGPGSGFIALTGGYGTLEELAEVITWSQLGIHRNGVCVININGFWDGLLAWMKRSNDEGFIRGGKTDILVEAKSAEEAVKALMEYKVSESCLDLQWGQE